MLISSITDLPFYYVGVAPFTYTHGKDKVAHTLQTLPIIWEAKAAALSVPNTEMITISDLIDKINVLHPSYKWEIGRRLSNVALAKKYGFKDLEFTGPRFKDMKVNGQEIIISFTHADVLKTSDGKPVNLLDLTGEDGIFKPANGVITNNKLIVSCPEIATPVQVRLGWHESPQPNLINSAGLPAMVFSTFGKQMIKR